MKRLTNLILAALLLLTINACDDENTKTKSILKTSGGKTSQVLVVMDNSYWKSAVGDSVRKVLQEVKPWFFQEEPYFDIEHIPLRAFEDVVYKKFRNILIVRINPDITKSIFKGRKNVYAKPQAVFEIKCKTKDDFFKLFPQKSEEMCGIFHQNELTRLKAYYSGIKVDSLTDFVNNKFGYKMIFPKGFFVAKDKADFLWLRRVTPDVEEGFLLYEYPYSDTSQLNPENIIAYRNELTKAFIPGPVDSSYMKVSTVFPYYSESTSFKGHYATLLRSWWDTHGYALGGPFLSYTIVDTAVGRLITIDGYLKAPKKNKRDLLLHLEAIMDSFEMKPAKSEK
jgi:hypothetical protein